MTIGNIILPPELNAAIGAERKDFATKARRAYPLKKSLITIAIGILCFVMNGAVLLTFATPMFFGNRAKTIIADFSIASPFLFPAIILGIIVLVGLFFVFYGIFMLMRSGGYFVGTPTRLIMFRSGILRSIDWRQFSGDITVSGDAKRGTLSLRMKSGTMVSRRYGPPAYVPTFIFLSGVPDAFAIAQYCRERIQQNDPMPATRKGVME